MPRKIKVIERIGVGRKACHSNKYSGIMAFGSLKNIRILMSVH